MHLRIFQAILGVAISWDQQVVAHNMKKVFLLFRRLIRFVWCDFWYFHVKGVDVFQAVRFYLIKFFSITVSISNLDASKFLPNLLLTLISLSLFSKDVESVERCLSWSMYFYVNLFFVSFRYSVSSERRTGSYPIFFNPSYFSRSLILFLISFISSLRRYFIVYMIEVDGSSVV